MAGDFLNNEKTMLEKRTVNETNLILIMIAVSILLFAAFIAIDGSLPDPVPGKIEKFLEKEGISTENIDFAMIEKITIFEPGLYRSSKPLFYNGRETELWQIYCTNLKFHTLYYIHPYYEGET